MFTKRMVFVLLLTLPFTVPAAIETASRLQAVPVDAPEEWVSFQGKFTDAAPAGEDPVTGEYWQASNGSTRIDSRRRMRSGTTVEWTSIVNTVLGRRFVLDPGQAAWDAYPLEARPSGWARPLKLSSLASKGDGPAFYGMRTIRVNQGDSEQLLVPELNLFPVWESRRGNVRQYTSIERIEPAPTRFEPPAGAEIRNRNAPKQRGAAR